MSRIEHAAAAQVTGAFPALSRVVAVGPVLATAAVVTAIGDGAIGDAMVGQTAIVTILGPGGVAQQVRRSALAAPALRAGLNHTHTNQETPVNKIETAAASAVDTGALRPLARVTVTTPVLAAATATPAVTMVSDGPMTMGAVVVDGSSARHRTAVLVRPGR